MDRSKVDSIIARAQMLMNNDEFNYLVEQHSSSRKGGGRKSSYSSSRGTMDPSLAAFEAQAGFSSGRKQAVMEQKSYNAAPKRKSGLPEEIQESFKKMPSPNNGLSTYSYSASQQQVPQQMVEQYTKQPSYGSTQQIDYSVLRAIVNECIRENMSNLLNESVGGTLTGIKMVGGAKMQFTDSKGNVYEGVLKRVK